jgi:hypothetical protein
MVHLENLGSRRLGMINKNDIKLIDEAILGMCLFGIWSDVHKDIIMSDIFCYVSIFYSIIAILVMILAAINTYKDKK